MYFFCFPEIKSLCHPFYYCLYTWISGPGQLTCLCGVGCQREFPFNSRASCELQLKGTLKGIVSRELCMRGRGVKKPQEKKMSSELFGTFQGFYSIRSLAIFSYICFYFTLIEQEKDCGAHNECFHFKLFPVVLVIFIGNYKHIFF